MKEAHQTAFDAAIAASASKAMYAGGGVSGTGFMLSNEFIGLVGLLIALAGFFVNLHFKRKDDKRLQAFHDAKMAQLGVYDE